MSSLADKSFSLFNRELLFTGIHIVTGAIVARKLGPSGFGLWAMFELVINYCRVFGGPRLEIAAVHFLGKKTIDPAELLSLINYVGFGLGVGIFLLLSMGQEILSEFFFKTTLSSFFISFVFAYIPFRFLLRNYMYIFLSQEDVKSYNRLMLIHDSCKGIVNIVLLVVFNMNLWSVAIAFHVSNLIALIYGISVVHRKIPWRWKTSCARLPELLRYSMKIYLSEAIGFLTIYFSNMVTAILLVPAALGFFAMAKGKAEYLNRISNAIGTILFPHVSNLNGMNCDSRKITERVFRLSFITFIIAGIFLALIIYPATLILYGRAFLPSVDAFFIILPGLILFGPSSLLRQYFLGIGRPEIPMYIQIVPLILQIVLCFMLIPPFRIIGGALAVSISFLVTSVITVIIYKKISSGLYKEFLIPKREDFKFLWTFGWNKLIHYFKVFHFRKSPVSH